MEAFVTDPALLSRAQTINGWLFIAVTAALLYVLIRRSWARRAGIVRALRESESRVRTILDAAVDAIITIDERGGVESLNQAAERLFGYSADEVIGRWQNVESVY